MSDTPQRSKFDEIEWAYDICDGSDEMHAYVSKLSGEVVYNNEEITGEPCPIEDIDLDNNYLHIPAKFDLNLGTQCVWEFVHTQIPGLEPKIRELFRGKGAYRRWKHWLERNDLLDRWYEFEETAQRKALRSWCDFHKIPLQD